MYNNKTITIVKDCSGPRFYFPTVTTNTEKLSEISLWVVSLQFLQQTDYMKSLNLEYLYSKSFGIMFVAFIEMLR